MIKRILNLSINLLNFALKGLFFILGAKFLDINDLGKLGVLFSYITIIVFFLGFEYWYFTNRKIGILLKKKKYKMTKILIFNQFYYSFTLYILTIIPVYILLRSRFPEINLILVIISIYSFYVIQETSRIFIYLEKQILASLSILSLAIWTIPVYIIWFVDIIPEMVSLHGIVHIYSFTLTICALLWTYILFKNLGFNILESFLLNKYFSLSIQRKAIKLSFIMFLSVITYKISELSPRIFLDLKKDYLSAGIITFYQSFALLSVGLVYQFISVFYVPKLLKEKNNKTNFYNILISFKKNIILYSFIFFLISIIIPIFVLKIFNIHGEYIEYYYVIIMFSFGYMLVNISNFYSYVAYIKNIDTVNYVSNILSFIGIIVSYIILSILKIDNILLVSFAFVIFALLQLLFKKGIYQRYISRD